MYKDIANVNLVLKFVGALKNEIFLNCQKIKDALNKRQITIDEIDLLRNFTLTCKNIVSEDICLNTIYMLESIK